MFFVFIVVLNTSRSTPTLQREQFYNETPHTQPDLLYQDQSRTVSTRIHTHTDMNVFCPSSFCFCQVLALISHKVSSPLLYLWGHGNIYWLVDCFAASSGLDSQDSALQISACDFWAAVEGFQPSVSEAELQRYQNIQSQLTAKWSRQGD